MLQVVELSSVSGDCRGELGIDSVTSGSDDSTNDPISVRDKRDKSVSRRYTGGRSTHIKLIPTDPLCDRIVDVVANTPVPTIRLTIRKVADINPS